DRSQWCGRSSGCGDLKYAGDQRPEQDASVAAPRSAAADGVVLADCQGSAAGRIDPKQFTYSEKGDGSTVRRPEGIESAFSSRDQPRVVAVQWTHPQPVLPVGGSHKGGHPPVRR